LESQTKKRKHQQTRLWQAKWPQTWPGPLELNVPKIVGPANGKKKMKKGEIGGQERK